MKRKGASGHFVQHHAKGKKIRARVKLLAAHLFRGHIRDRSERTAGTGKLVGVHFHRGQTVYARSAFQRADLGQAEIENLRVAPFGHKNICRLDITVHDALQVSCIERFRDFYAQRQ